MSIRAPRVLHQLHETLCFLVAYPDDADVLRRADEALASFARSGEAARACGAARSTTPASRGTFLAYPFGLPMARWLARTSPRGAHIVWAKLAAESEIEETLSLLVLPIEGEAMSDEGGLGWRRWLRLAKGDRAASDLALLVELFDRAPLPPDARERLFDGAGALDRMATRGGSISDAGPAAVAAPVLSRWLGGPPSSVPTGAASGARSCGRWPPSGAAPAAARPRADRRGSRGDGHSAPRALRLLARQCRRRPRGGPRARPPDRADRHRPARAPAASRLLRLPRAQERGAGQLRRGLADLRCARGRRERLRVVSARRVGVHRLPGAARLSPGVRHAAHHRRSLSDRSRQSRGPRLGGVLLLSAPGVPFARSRRSSDSPGRRTPRSEPGRPTGRLAPSSDSSPRPRSACPSAAGPWSQALRSTASRLGALVTRHVAQRVRRR